MLYTWVGFYYSQKDAERAERTLNYGFRAINGQNSIRKRAERAQKAIFDSLNIAESTFQISETAQKELFYHAPITITCHKLEISICRLHIG